MAACSKAGAAALPSSLQNLSLQQKYHTASGNVFKINLLRFKIATLIVIHIVALVAGLVRPCLVGAHNQDQCTVNENTCLRHHVVTLLDNLLHIAMFFIMEK